MRFILLTGNISYHQSTIFYRRFGTGKKKLFCFHGYGESSEIFIFFNRFFGKDFTFIAFDLPFHAQTQWNGKLIFTTQNLIEIMNEFVAKNEKFYLLGYSMGGRLALHLLETVPQKIKKVFLFAPDGLHKNFWYNFSTQTFAGNKLFAFIVKHPAWFLAMLKLGKTIKLINEHNFYFAHQFLNDETNRMLLYKRWTAFRKIKPNLPHLKKIIQQNNVQVKMLFGKLDKIILTKHALKFKKEIENKVAVTEIEAGHQLLKIKYIDEIVKLFNS